MNIHTRFFRFILANHWASEAKGFNRIKAIPLPKKNISKINLYATHPAKTTENIF